MKGVLSRKFQDVFGFLEFGSRRVGHPMISYFLSSVVDETENWIGSSRLRLAITSKLFHFCCCHIWPKM